MCGIAAMSLAPGSKIKPKALANALLTQIEDRGYMTSGFAAFNRDGSEFGFDKGPGLGSRMSLKEMPADTTSAIFHTRYATKGSIHINENNHPVVSLDKQVLLVHNGVIRNDEYVRKNVLKNAVGLPEVDTAVIPQLVAEQGTDGFAELSGDAAVAWFDVAQPNVINIAKIEHSPVTIATLADGSLVMASTQDLLTKALVMVGLEEGAEYHTLSESEYVQFVDGELITMGDVPKAQGKGAYGSTMRGATAGGYVSARSTSYTSRYDSWFEDSVGDIYDKYGWPVNQEDWPVEASQAYRDTIGLDNDFYDVWGMSDTKMKSSRFFTEDYEGNRVYFRSATDLKDTLDTLKARTGAELFKDSIFDGMDDETKQTYSPLLAAYLDLGHVGAKSGIEYSWGEDPTRALAFGANTGSAALALAYSLNAFLYTKVEPDTEPVEGPLSTSIAVGSTGVVAERDKRTFVQEYGDAQKAQQVQNVQFVAPTLTDPNSPEHAKSSTRDIKRRPGTEDDQGGYWIEERLRDGSIHIKRVANLNDDDRPPVSFMEGDTPATRRVNGAIASFNESTRRMDTTMYARTRDMFIDWCEATLTKEAIEAPAVGQKQ